MTEGEPTPTTAIAAQQRSTPAPLAPPPSKPRFWNKKRIVVTVITIIALMVAMCGCATLAAWRFISAEAESMAAMRPFVDEGYPGYRIVDSTRSGYILQHGRHEALRLDVRFEKLGQLAVWEGPPREDLSDGWSTAETFFRHAEGMPPDPRTNMTYDVDGFVEAYAPLRPGPNCVVSAVWLDGTDPDGVETYVVLVARRDRRGSYVEDMWPDHRAVFTRDSSTGHWTGSAFEPVEIPNPN